MILSFLIPVFNEESTIQSLLTKIDRLSIKNTTKEIIIVNDGSTDKSEEIIRKFIKKKKGYYLINKNSNTGKGAAIKAALERSKGNIIILQDADLEYSPENISSLLSYMQDKSLDIVYGSRRMNKKNKFSSLPYFLGGVFINSLIALILKRRITDAISGTKIFSRKVYHAIKPIESKGFDIDVEITSKAVKKGFQIVEVPIVYKPRKHNKGKKIRWYHGFSIVRTLLKYGL